LAVERTFLAWITAQVSASAADDLHTARIWTACTHVLGRVSASNATVKVVYNRTTNYAYVADNLFYATVINVTNTSRSVAGTAIVAATLAGGTSETASVNFSIPGRTELPVYNARGMILSDSRRRYVWDAAGRLTAVTNTGVSPAVLLKFAYYPDGRRATKTVLSLTNGVWTTARSLQYAWQGWKFAGECERDGAGSVTAVRSFVWGPDIEGQQSASLESAAEGTGGLLLIREWKPSGTRLYLPLTDGLGSVCGLIDAADGSLAAEYDYDPYGNPVVARGSAMDACPFRHRTRYYDPETWLYYYGYRYYDPSVTKWISKDPLGEAGGWNLTCFCGNDPVNGYDPLGLWAEGGHYYTVLYVALAAGYSKDDALTLAFFAQYPDYVKEFEAWDYVHERRNLATIGLYCAGVKRSLGEESLLIEDFGHSLLDCEASKLRTLYRSKWSELPSVEEKGLLLHSFGDLYGHAFDRNGVDWLYPKAIGHARKLSRPDHIGENQDQYVKYVRDLYDLLKGNSGGKSNNVMIDQLLASTSKFASNFTKTGVTYEGKGRYRKYKWYDSGAETAEMRRLAQNALQTEYSGSSLPRFNPGATTSLDDVTEGVGDYGLRSGAVFPGRGRYLNFLREIEGWSR
jgi:RHS repeat-associated protein